MDPAERAALAAETAGIDIQRLHGLDQAVAAVEISRATWGDTNLVPPEAFRAIQESGNPLHGAFRGGELIGIAIGWYGRDEDGWHLHSHQLAVLPDRRSKGVGYALKLAQRADALGDGVARIRWTFDPLQSRNAYLNLTKLGASADAFYRDFYGQMDDDLNAGDRSDRLLVRWDLLPEPPTEGEPREALEALAQVAIPRDFSELKQRDPNEAALVREATSNAFEKHFAAGLEVAGFTTESGYLFVPKGPRS